MKFFKSQRGDTILEVLIVIGVLSLVLTSSFVVANRSSQSNLKSQERGEGSKHSQSQLELLKKYITETSNPTLPASGNFCMNRTDGKPTSQISAPIPANAQSENFAAFTGPYAACKNTDNGREYYSYISRNGDVFTSHTRWYRAGGGGIEEANMAQRIYPALAASGTTIGGSNQIPQVGCPPNFYMNGVGGCTVCPNGYDNSNPYATSCNLIPPRIIVTVKKIIPNYGNFDPTPSCSKNAYENRAGTAVRLTNATDPAAQVYTNPLSQAIFTGLDLNTDYTATVPSPQGGYQLCAPPGPAQQTVRSGGVGTAVGVGTTTSAPQQFIIRPICNIARYRTEDHGYYYLKTVVTYTTVYWWQNSGYFGYPMGQYYTAYGPHYINGSARWTRGLGLAYDGRWNNPWQNNLAGNNLHRDGPYNYLRHVYVLELLNSGTQTNYSQVWAWQVVNVQVLDGYNCPS